MFIGQYEHSIDEKGRLAFPAKFRKDLQAGAVVTKGLDGCLFVFPKAKFKQMADSISRLPYTKSAARLYSRLILSNAGEIEFDKQGRVHIPPYLKSHAKLKKTAVICGLYDRIEIWSDKNWEEVSKKVSQEAGEVVEELSAIEI